MFTTSVISEIKIGIVLEKNVFVCAYPYTNNPCRETKKKKSYIASPAEYDINNLINR